jgi:hypothetical protein
VTHLSLAKAEAREKLRQKDSERLISKPPGQAGRTGASGYSLMKAMGLSDSHYNRLLVSICVHIMSIYARKPFYRDLFEAFPVPTLTAAETIRNKTKEPLTDLWRRYGPNSSGCSSISN